MSRHGGGCLCGAVRYEITGELAAIQICHCSQCRKAQGAPFATNIPVSIAQLRFLSGRDTIREYASSPGKLRAFCPTCGSPIYSRRPDTPDTLRIRAGTLDAPVASRPLAHFYVGSKADWWTISDALPQFEGPYVPTVRSIN